MNRFELLVRRQDIEAAFSSGYLTAREYADAMAELQLLWDELHR
jgi:hypothetical protein